MASDYPQMEATMNRAYDRWQDGWSQQTFMGQLTQRERFVVQLGNLNAQVCNGGFAQYMYNSYATRDAVYGVLDSLGKIISWEKRQGRLTHEETAALKIVEKFRDLCVHYGFAAHRDQRTEEDEERFNDRLEELELDNKFYEVNEAMMASAERYLVANFPADPPSREEILEMLDNVSAAAESLLGFSRAGTTAQEFATREKLIMAARVLCDKELRADEVVEA